MAGAVGAYLIARNPKENHFPLYRGVSVITPNTREAGDAVGMKIKDEASLLEVGRRLKKLTGESGGVYFAVGVG